jgi:hypothetical protein
MRQHKIVAVPARTMLAVRLVAVRLRLAVTRRVAVMMMMATFSVRHRRVPAGPDMGRHLRGSISARHG